MANEHEPQERSPLIRDLLEKPKPKRIAGLLKLFSKQTPQEKGPLPFCEPTQIVQFGKDSQIYLISHDLIKQGKWKRLIPSHETLHELGLLPIDVAEMSEDDKNDYAEHDPLTDPQEISRWKEALINNMQVQVRSYYGPNYYAAKTEMPQKPKQ